MTGVQRNLLGGGDPVSGFDALRVPADDRRISNAPSLFPESSSAPTNSWTMRSAGMMTRKGIMPKVQAKVPLATEAGRSAGSAIALVLGE
jgi:hypothetical protein